MSATVLRDLSALAGIESEWNRLLVASGGTPFQSHEWAMSWLETLGKDAAPHVATVAGGDGLAAIAPFCRRPGRTFTLVGYPQNDYGGLLVDPCAPEAFAELAAVFAAWQRGRRRILLEQLPEAHPAWRALLPRLTEWGTLWSLLPGDPCPALAIETPEAARALYATLGFTRWINWFKRNGTLAFTVEATSDGIAARLEDLFEQHVRRWEGTDTPSAFRDPCMRDFHRAFTSRMTRRGWVRMGVLTLDDVFLALVLFFEYDSVLYLYKASYNIEYRRRSPGQLVFHYLLEYALSRGVRELDFTRGDEGYKNRFCNVVRRNHHLLVHGTRAEKWVTESRLSLARSRALRAALRKPPLPPSAADGPGGD